MKKLLKSMLFLTFLLLSFTTFNFFKASNQIEVLIKAITNDDEITIFNKSVLYGTNFQVESSETDFVFWIVDGVLSEERLSKTTFKAVRDFNAYAIYASSEFVVIYVDYSGKLISYHHTSDVSLVSDPTNLPDKIGYVTNGFETTKYNGHEVRRLRYVKDDSKDFVYINDIAYEFNSIVTIDATNPDFTHFLEDGKIVSFNETYRFSALEDRTIVEATGAIKTNLITLKQLIEYRDGYNTYLGYIENDNVLEFGLEINSIKRRASIINQATNEFLISISNKTNIETIRAYMSYYEGEEIVTTYSEYVLRPSYTLTIDVDGIFTTYEFLYNEEVIIDLIPEKAGFTFVGWSEQIDYMPATDMFIYAEWSEQIINFNLPSNVSLNKESINYNERVVLTVDIPLGKYIKEFLVNGTNVLDNMFDYQTYVIENAIEDYQVEISYADLEEFTIMSKANTSGAIEGGTSVLDYLEAVPYLIGDVTYLRGNNGTNTVFGNNAKEIRLYPGGTNGSTIVIDALLGYEIYELIVEIADENGGFSVNGEGNYTYQKSSQAIIIDQTSQIVIQNINSATSGTSAQVRIKSIKVKLVETGYFIPDETPPTIVLKDNVSLIYEFGDSFNFDNLENWVNVSDNQDPNVTLTIDASSVKLDKDSKFDTEGTFEIVFKAVDASGNETTLIVKLRVFISLDGLLESLDYSGFNDYYLSLNNSSDVITDMALLLRDTVRFQTYQSVNNLWVPLTDEKQVVLYDYPGRPSYGNALNGWVSGGYVSLVGGEQLLVDKEHVWSSANMRIKPYNNVHNITTYVPYVINDHTDGSFTYSPGQNSRGHYSDYHNLWIADASTNRARGNNFQGESNGPSIEPYNYNGIFYPGDEYIGDIARIMFYMTLMYPHLTILAEGEEAIPGTVYQSYLETLLDWNQRDPVSDYEIARNEIIFARQGNRNPFVDFYEFDFAEMLFIFGDPNVLDN